MSRHLVARLRSQGGVMSLPVGWYSVALSTQYSAARQEDQRFGAASSIEVPAAPSALAVLMQTCAQLRSEADEVVCATTPEPFRAVCMWYDDFSQTSDEEVRELLARAEQDAAHAS